ncbi:hypothetical protein Sviol_43390 [Streptomyces violascens]|uniref:Uncharacterized protein n=1 Tax=Streptomyces violascens TaxID=67381 RepID=A0ABQ3QRN2_9ACTN|nr:hypothetical protein Sviol_43390 [Streptomyces violascens]
MFGECQRLASAVGRVSYPLNRAQLLEVVGQCHDEAGRDAHHPGDLKLRRGPTRVQNNHQPDVLGLEFMGLDTGCEEIGRRRSEYAEAENDAGVHLAMGHRGDVTLFKSFRF